MRLAGLISTCGLGAALVSGGTAAAASARVSYGFPNIRHVVIVVQEERSFDDLFQGFPGADTQAYGYTSQGKRIALKPLSYAARFSVAHEARDFELSFDGGKNDGFNRERTACGAHFNERCSGMLLPQYSYVPASETQPYFSIAGQYVLGDRMFGSTYDGEFESHLDFIAAQDGRTIGIPSSRPWGCDNRDGVTVVDRLAPLQPVFPCFDFPTLADELDAASLRWRYYAPGSSDIGYDWSSFDAVDHIRNGPDWAADVASPASSFLRDVASGELANVSWVTPDFQNSELSTLGEGPNGPAWVASVVNAVGESKFWDSTAIFITWSNYGGFYDHVPPPQDADQGRSFRVPLLIVSPYVSHGRVTHEQYQSGSLLKFTEEAFGLSPLTRLDARANSPAREFNFQQQPRTFVPIAY